jgi:hypothetical protein
LILFHDVNFSLLLGRDVHMRVCVLLQPSSEA